MVCTTNLIFFSTYIYFPSHFCLFLLCVSSSVTGFTIWYMLVSRGVLEEMLFPVILSDFCLFLVQLWEAILWLLLNLKASFSTVVLLWLVLLYLSPNWSKNNGLAVCFCLSIDLALRKSIQRNDLHLEVT